MAVQVPAIERLVVDLLPDRVLENRLTTGGVTSDADSGTLTWGCTTTDSTQPLFKVLARGRFAANNGRTCHFCPVLSIVPFWCLFPMFSSG